MADAAALHDVVVEREGEEDALVRVSACTVAALRAAVVETLSLDAFCEWDLKLPDSRPLGDDRDGYDPLETPRVLVAPAAKHVAAQKLQARGLWPVDRHIFERAVVDQDAGLLALLVECEEVSPKILSAALHGACKTGDVPVIRTLLEVGVPTSLVDVYGRAPLATAILSGDEAVCLGLLTAAADTGAGVPVNHRDAEDRTALHHAAKMGMLAVLARLIALGADLNARDEDGATALLRAVRLEQPGVAAFLLKEGCDPNIPDSEGCTALLHAVEAGQEAICQALLEHNPDLAVADACGQTALIHAASRGLEAVCVKLIALGADVNVADHWAWTALLHGAKIGSEGICMLLLDHDASVNVRDACGKTPLIHAAHQRLESVALRLLQHGADPHAKDMYGHTALLAATENALEGLSVVLLERNVDVDAKDATGTTALVHACNTGLAESVRSTLQRRQSLLD